MHIDRDIYTRLKAISELKDWHIKPKLQEFIKELKPRGVLTRQQQKALHLWFRLVADELNNGDYNVQLVLKEKMDMEWDGDKVKELLWRPAQKVILKKESTTKLNKIEDIEKVYEHLNRHLGEKFGINVDFPSEERTLLEMTY